MDVMFAYVKCIWCCQPIRNTSDLDVLHRLDLSMSSKPLWFLSLNVVMHMETVLYMEVNLTNPVKCIHLMIYNRGHGFSLWGVPSPLVCCIS